MEIGNGEQKELNLPLIAIRALKIVATKQNFVTYNIESGNKVGNGGTSLILRMTIIGTKKDGTNVVEFPVLCKMQCASKLTKESLNLNELFKREIALYNDYLPELVKLQQEYGISEKEGFFNFPTCYYGEYNEETDDAIIIMQDIRDEGYQVLNKTKDLDIEFYELVVRGLAKLTALSFVLERKRPDIFSKFKEYDDRLQQFMLHPTNKAMWDSGFSTAVNSFQGKYPHIKEKLEKLRDNYPEEFKFLADAKNSGKYSVIRHGDSWANNFLFTFDPEGKPQNIKLIDFQHSCYGSPILDLAYFLFFTSDKKARDQHYMNLLKLYHESFSTLLQKFGESTEEIFSYDVFQEELKKFGRYGLLLSLFYFPFESMDEVGNVDEKITKLLEPRIRDLILDFDRLGYF